MMEDFPISFGVAIELKMFIMNPAEVLLLGFRCVAPFIVLFAYQQLPRPDIYREACRRVAADSYRLLCIFRVSDEGKIYSRFFERGRFLAIFTFVQKTRAFDALVQKPQNEVRSGKTI